MNNEDFKRMLKLRSFNLARGAMKLTDKFPQKRSGWIICDQLLRSITSIGANIIEAQAASSKKDFINFLNHALKSGNEAKFWLALSRELDEKIIPEIEKLLKETDELTKILGSSIATLKGKNKLETTDGN
jgi:four helix bundle protein